MGSPEIYDGYRVVEQGSSPGTAAAAGVKSSPSMIRTAATMSISNSKSLGGGGDNVIFDFVSLLRKLDQSAI
uniref:Uncharacterized protein n=1 Tax=Oryza punctata TaxID=4537 RepID=A0A0E0LJU3_ORYPU